MKPRRFDYACPQSVEEALSTLRAASGRAKVLAGGQSLVPLLNARSLQVDVLIDLNRLSSLSYVVGAPGEICVGALTRYRHIETSSAIRETLPILAHATSEIGGLAVRNRGTLGGSLAHADPAAELPLIAVALDARLVLRSQRGERELAARDFFVGPFRTAAQPDELLCEVRFPIPSGQAGWGFRELPRQPGLFPIAAVACQIALDERGVCVSACLAAGGAHPTPIRFEAGERVLAGSTADHAAITEAANIAARAVDPPSDVHASAGYRRRLVEVLATRALHDAWSRAAGQQEAPEGRAG